MLIDFSPIFVANTKLILCHNFGAPSTGTVALTFTHSKTSYIKLYSKT